MSRRPGRGWGVLGAAVLVAGLGLMVGAQASHAAEGDVSGQTPEGAIATQDWTSKSSPSFIYTNGGNSPSASGLGAPGYEPIQYEGATLKSIGYCIEPGVSGTAPQYRMLYPSSYLAGANERGNVVSPNVKANLGKITWVAQNSYPAVDVATLNSRAHINATAADYFNATQSALWYFANGMEMTTGNTRASEMAYAWLIRNAVPVAPAQPQLSVGTGSASGTVNGASSLIGPITVNAYHTISNLTVKAENVPGGVTLTDAGGREISGTLRNGDQVFAKVLAGVPSGSLTLTFTGQGHTTVNGMIGVGTAHSGDRMAQSQIIVGKPTPATMTATAKLSWIGSSVRAASPAPQMPLAAIPAAQATRPAMPSQSTKPRVPADPSAPAARPRPQSPGLPMTGVSDSTQTMAVLGLALALAGIGVTLMATRRPSPRRR